MQVHANGVAVVRRLLGGCSRRVQLLFQAVVGLVRLD